MNLLSRIEAYVRVFDREDSGVELSARRLASADLYQEVFFHHLTGKWYADLLNPDESAETILDSCIYIGYVVTTNKCQWVLPAPQNWTGYFNSFVERLYASLYSTDRRPCHKVYDFRFVLCRTNGVKVSALRDIGFYTEHGMTTEIPDHVEEQSVFDPVLEEDSTEDPDEDR